MCVCRPLLNNCNFLIFAIITYIVTLETGSPNYNFIAHNVTLGNVSLNLAIVIFLCLHAAYWWYRMTWLRKWLHFWVMYCITFIPHFCFKERTIVRGTNDKHSNSQWISEDLMVERMSSGPYVEVQGQSSGWLSQGWAPIIIHSLGKKGGLMRFQQPSWQPIPPSVFIKWLCQRALEPRVPYHLLH